MAMSNVANCTSHYTSPSMLSTTDFCWYQPIFLGEVPPPHTVTVLAALPDALAPGKVLSQ